MTVFHWIFYAFTLLPAIQIILYLRTFMRNIKYVDQRITSKSGFKLIIYLLACVNAFRIIHEIFISIASNYDEVIPNLVKLTFQ